MDDAHAAAAALGPHDVAIVLGSGWVDAVSGFEQIGEDIRLATLPGVAIAVAGQRGRRPSVGLR